MTYDDLKLILEQYDELKKAAICSFVKYHCTVKIGDVVERFASKIRVDKITVSIGIDGRPCPVYHGFVLRKDGKPKANGQRASIYGESALKNGEFLSL